MHSTIFRGTKIRFADLRRAKEAGLFTRIHLTSDWTDLIRDAMGWEDLPDSISSAKLDGGLIGKTMVLTPNGLKQHEIQLDVHDVGNFEYATVADGEDSQHSELRFVMRTAAVGAAALIENYMRVVGEAVGELRISFERQDELDLQEGASEEAAEVDTEAPQSASLAPAAVVRGNRGKRARVQEMVVRDPEGEVILRGEAAEAHPAAEVQ